MLPDVAAFYRIYIGYCDISVVGYSFRRVISIENILAKNLSSTKIMYTAEALMCLNLMCVKFVVYNNNTIKVFVARLYGWKLPFLYILFPSPSFYNNREISISFTCCLHFRTFILYILNRQIYGNCDRCYFFFPKSLISKLFCWFLGVIVLSSHQI